MGNPIPLKLDAVLALVVKMASGLGRYGDEVGVTWMTESTLSNARITAEAAIRGYGEARAVKQSAYAAHFAADAEAARFIHKSRNLLALIHGESWSDGWAPTGFIDESTATPSSIDGRQTVVRGLQNYFANHALHENAALGITAVQAGIIYSTSVTARSAVAEALTQVAMAKAQRDLALEQLRRKMRCCIEELETLLTADDARWYAFGLTPPAESQKPEPTVELQLTHGGPGIVLASWTNPPRADRYRLFKQVVGVDAEPVPVETVRGTQFAFTGLIAGQTLKVMIIAGNEVGESDPSETFEIVVA